MPDAKLSETVPAHLVPWVEEFKAVGVEQSLLISVYGDNPALDFEGILTRLRFIRNRPYSMANFTRSGVSQEEWYPVFLLILGEFFEKHTWLLSLLSGDIKLINSVILSSTAYVTPHNENPGHFLALCGLDKILQRYLQENPQLGLSRTKCKETYAHYFLLGGHYEKFKAFIAENPRLRDRRYIQGNIPRGTGGYRHGDYYCYPTYLTMIISTKFDALRTKMLVQLLADHQNLRYWSDVRYLKERLGENTTREIVRRAKTIKSKRLAEKFAVSDGRLPGALFSMKELRSGGDEALALFNTAAAAQATHYGALLHQAIQADRLDCEAARLQLKELKVLIEQLGFKGAKVVLAAYYQEHALALLAKAQREEGAAEQQLRSQVKNHVAYKTALACLHRDRLVSGSRSASSSSTSLSRVFSLITSRDVSTVEGVLTALETSVRSGSAYATFELGQCFEMGFGKPKNLGDALHHYFLAAQAGFEKAKQKFKMLSLNQNPTVACLSLIYEGLLKQHTYYFEEAMKKTPLFFVRLVLGLSEKEDIPIKARLVMLVNAVNLVTQKGFVQADDLQAALNNQLEIFLQRASNKAEVIEERVSYVGALLSPDQFITFVLRCVEDKVDLSEDKCVALLVRVSQVTAASGEKILAVQRYLSECSSFSEQFWKERFALPTRPVMHSSSTSSSTTSKESKSVSVREAAALDELSIAHQVEIESIVDKELGLFKEEGYSTQNVLDILKYVKAPDAPLSQVENRNLMYKATRLLGQVKSDLVVYYHEPEMFNADLNETTKFLARDHFLAILAARIAALETIVEKEQREGAQAMSAHSFDESETESQVSVRAPSPLETEAASSADECESESALAAWQQRKSASQESNSAALVERHSSVISKGEAVATTSIPEPKPESVIAQIQALEVASGPCLSPVAETS